ncbi:MAG: hypothetical protein INR71_06825 [Terriglobus roseus]|nr:hypothetical protein [Terriglobus roseus]
MSRTQKYRHRQRMRRVDGVVATLDRALARRGLAMRSVERWKAEMPAEEEMRPRDKYTMFDRKVRGYRKGVHSMFSAPFIVDAGSWRRAG